MIDGKQTEARAAKDGRDLMVPLSVLASSLHALATPVPGVPGAFMVNVAGRRVRLQLGKGRISVWSGPRDQIGLISLLAEAPYRDAAGIWVPASVVSLLGAKYERDASGAVTITCEAEQDDGPDSWLKALGLPGGLDVRRGDLSITDVRMASTTGKLVSGNQVVLNVKLSRYPATVQVYEVNPGGVEPVLAQEDGGVSYYPRKFGIDPIPVSISAALRIPMLAAGAGKFTYVVLATTQTTRQELREILLAKRATGDWAIAGTHVEIAPRAAGANGHESH